MGLVGRNVWVRLRIQGKTDEEGNCMAIRTIEDNRLG